MLDELELVNFKAWRELDVKFGKITGLFGPNSAGKSSLLQFLLMLKQTKNAADRRLTLDLGGPNDIVNLGTFRDVVHLHDDDAEIRWTLDWTLLERLRVAAPTPGRGTARFRGNSLRIECQVAWREPGLWADSLVYEFGGAAFGLESSSDGPAGFDLHADSKRFEFIRGRGRPWALPGPVKTHRFPDQARTSYQNADFLGEFEAAYEALMDRIFYLGPLREYPQRQYTWAGARPEDVGQQGERTVDALLAASAHRERRHLGKYKRYKPFQEFIAQWLRDLGLVESFDIREVAEGSNIYRALVRKHRSGAETPLTDVGFGVSQVLPVLVLLFYVPEGSIVLMEHPEIHLHPAVQSGLADAMISASQTRGVQLIVESHSEHLMRRLQRRVAEGGVPSDDVKLYFTSMEDGAARLFDLELNEWGEIENWPDNFFGDRFGELASTRMATLDRRIGHEE